MEPLPSMYPSEVKPTKNGLGLFATTDLDVGEIVERYEGPVSKYEDVPEQEIGYALLIKNDEWLVPKTNARVLNHSCEPNCYISDDLKVVTQIPVQKGEELTISYTTINMADHMAGEEGGYFWDPRWTFECRCGSAHCVGLINRYVVEPLDDPNSSKIYVHTTAGKGRGVFAKRSITKGEVIERAPVVVISQEEWPQLEKTILADYAYEWGDKGEQAAVALGHVSVYNHSYSPNAMYLWSIDDLTIEVVALRDIQPGHEIVLNYNGEPDDPEPLWFKAV